MADDVIVDNDTVLGAAVWDDKPVIPAAQIVAPIMEEKKVEEPVIVEEKKVEPEEEILDTKDYIKARFGWESEEQGVEELRTLREKAQTPAELKFANEQSRKFYEAISEGKEDEIYQHLSDKKKLDRAEKLDLSNVANASEIIKLSLEYKYRNSDLTAEEVQDYFQEMYSKPAKPQQGELQTTEDYEAQVSQWKQQCEGIDKRIIREAKMVKPDLAKYKTELILPKIEKAAEVSPQPSQEDLAKADQDKKAFFQQVDKGLSQLKGFGSTYKDKDVEILVSYDITSEGKTKLKPIIESLYTDWSYFANRWQEKDGSWNTEKMGKDLYLLENGGNVHQKLVNDSAAKMLEHVVKTKKNLNVTGPTAPTKVEQKDGQQKFEEAVWS